MGFRQFLLNLISDHYYDPEESASKFLSALQSGEAEHKSFLNDPEFSKNAMLIYEGHLAVLQDAKKQYAYR